MIHTDIRSTPMIYLSLEYTSGVDPIERILTYAFKLRIVDFRENMHEHITISLLQ